jgi:prepilin-type N-terminal cleavage/methylation domain-containing protein
MAVIKTGTEGVEILLCYGARTGCECERCKKMTTLLFRRRTRGGAPSGAAASPCEGRSGFTIIELIIVVVIIAIAALVAVPLASSAASTQVRTAANMVAADIEYAKSMAISRGQWYSVAFDKNNESYNIKDQSDTVIPHPVKKGSDYVVSFRNDSRLGKVDIVDADFDGTSQVKFDYLGSPYDGGNNPLNSGQVSLQAGTNTMQVNVEPVTGFISIEQ